uniref:Uncharacterized protein n=1 Tax=Meloidogyne enterolobii TaxID=390850 RepID=A0A6V7Y6G0_MELEN|nr:unnamed protein product [Meloidogyne enterolobii]
MESPFEKINFGNSKSCGGDSNTFSKTCVILGRAKAGNSEMENIVGNNNSGGKTKEIKPYFKNEQTGNFVHPKSTERPFKIVSRELPSSEVSVSLLISRNHNASISASCYFNSKQQQSLPAIRKFNNINERNSSFPLKTPRLKIVEIPFEEKELIIKGAKLGGGTSSPSYIPTSPPIFTWPNFKNSNKSDSTGIGSSLSVSSNNSSSGDSDHHHFFSQNKSKDYRVISLDEKPNPGRLDDFVPEVERENNEIKQREKKKEGENKYQQKFYNFPSLNRNYSNIYGENKWSEPRGKLTTENGCGKKKETAPLERDEFGRLVIPSNEWRKFLAEQRPSSNNRINSQLQIVFRKDNYTNL